ncbi:MAG TPA: tetratricopeptide repeat protein [Gaiellaceae bacterium]|nr:tetratricopeptide repeat protein [Gaiellaceae bacterium]
MNRPTSTQPQRLLKPASLGLGERLRQLRVAAGLTQGDVAGDRFSKEYVSQIERGKTRPTAETVQWLAERLGVDASFLANGVSTDERGRVEGGLARAEALAQSDRCADAIAEYDNLRSAVLATGAPELEARALKGEARARAVEGDVRHAIPLFERARELYESASFSDIERAEVVYDLGVARYKLSSISTAIGLFNAALQLAERSELPCDLLRSKILEARSRCYRRQRDFQAAKEDVERALELAQAAEDQPALASAYFQASIVAEREGHWVLARSYAEQAKSIYAMLSEERHVGRLLNNIGGLNFLLGKPEEAVPHLKEAFRIALDLGHEADAAQAVSSLAQVHLRTGNVDQAEEQARHALRLLDGRVDFLDEIGNAQLVLGRSLLQQERLDEAEEQFQAADSTFEQLSSLSHRAAAWVALGDLATRRGADREAAHLYRRAAEALQDFRW